MYTIAAYNNLTGQSHRSTVPTFEAGLRAANDLIALGWVAWVIHPA
jgi:hypothetical protein